MEHRESKIRYPSWAWELDLGPKNADGLDADHGVDADQADQADDADVDTDHSFDADYNVDADCANVNADHSFNTHHSAVAHQNIDADDAGVLISCKLVCCFAVSPKFPCITSHKCPQHDGDEDDN